MNRYCLALIFDASGRRLLLIKKSHPDWQKDLYNAPGGELKGSEGPRTAASREVREELGIAVPVEAWVPVASLHGAEIEIDALKILDDRAYKEAWAQEDEPLVRVPCSFGGIEVISFHHKLPLVPHLRWLVALALEDVPPVKVGLELPPTLKAVKKEATS